jgi:hypothetical protein
MRTRIGRVSLLSIVLGLVIAGVIVTGLIVPGRTGTLIETGGWIALAVCIIFEVGLRSTPIGKYDGNDRRPG